MTTRRLIAIGGGGAVLFCRSRPSHIPVPLLRMGMYSLTSAQVREFVDPVMRFMDGDGI
jgi:hypothetical protein